MTSVDTELVEQRLRAMGGRVSRWADGPGGRFAAHAHDYDKVLVASRGSITFLLMADGATVPLAAGDRLDLPAGTSHAAVVGPDGVECLEANLPAGGSGSHIRHVAGWALGGPGAELRPGWETVDGAGT